MAQSHRLLDADKPKTTVLVIVQVRAANAAKSNPHTQLVGKNIARIVGRVRVEMLQAQVKCAVTHQGTDSPGLFKAC